MRADVHHVVAWISRRRRLPLPTVTWMYSQRMALNPLGDVLQRADRTLKDGDVTLGTVDTTLGTVDHTLGVVKYTLSTVTSLLSTVTGLLSDLEDKMTLIDELPNMKIQLETIHKAIAKK